MKRKSFVSGAVILGAAGIIVKLMGAIFRIPVTNWLGGAMAYYTAAYPVYSLLLTLSVTGIPVAVSRMIAERAVMEDYYAANKVLNAAVKLLLGIGIGTGVLCFFGAGWYSRMVGLPETSFALQALVPALILIPVMSAYRGYFQGLQNMKPTACSQIMEQLFRVVVGLVLAWVLLQKFAEHPEFAAAGATFGASAGAIGGLLTIWLIYMADKKNRKKRIRNSERRFNDSNGRIMKLILIIAIPITLGACIMPIMNLIDAAIVSNKLQAMGYSYADAKELYTELSSMAGTIFNFPQILLQGIAVSIVPAISMAYEINDTEGLHDNVKMGVRMANILSFPCMLGLILLAKPVLMLLYAGQAEMAADASTCLAILSIGLIFLSLTQMLTGVLQGVGKQNIPVINLAIGAAAKAVVTYVLVGVPALNVNGAAIGTVAAYIVATYLNFRSVKKYVGIDIDWNLSLVRPLIATIGMGIATIVSYKLLALVIEFRIAALISILISIVVYAFLVLKTKTITIEEVSTLPKGDKIAKLLSKFTK